MGELNRPQKRILALVTDAYGGIGGIAKFNRDFLRACCSWDKCLEVVAIPRVAPLPSETRPAKLRWLNQSINSKLKYLLTVLGLLIKKQRFDLLVCAHLNLLPIICLIHVLTKTPFIVLIYGIEAWASMKNTSTRRYLRHAKTIISVSDFTTSKFLKWAGVNVAKCVTLYPCVDLTEFTPAPKNTSLTNKYMIAGKRILMTVGRMCSRERFKGFDEILDIMPDLLTEHPDLIYMLVGDGMDRTRLEEKAKQIGISNHVIFTGYIPEDEKPDYYRLADIYVMPSRGEGFGIVLLEALACGIPVIASCLDGGAEAVQYGLLGDLVDPNNLEAVRIAIKRTLQKGKKGRLAGIENFSYTIFEKKIHCIIQACQ